MPRIDLASVEELQTLAHCIRRDDFRQSDHCLGGDARPTFVIQAFTLEKIVQYVRS